MKERIVYRFMWCLLGVVLAMPIVGQSSRAEIDSVVCSLKYESNDLSQVSAKLTKRFTNDEEKITAIYCYVLNRMSYDDMKAIELDSDTIGEKISYFTSIQRDSIISERFEKQAKKGSKYHGINRLEIFPNPASDYFTLDFTSIETGELSIELYNNIGQRVLSQALYNETVDIHDLVNGIYTVIVRNINGGTSYRSQLTIAR